MGLSGPKNRSKIGVDPNNTAWSNSTTGFGHRMLSAQGWTPGSYLGAKDAAHASHFSAANSSHIRVLLKDDNLGLGAKRGQAEGHNFGLGTFQDLLGRLNGKSEVQIQKDVDVRADLGRKLYAHQRWGPSKFVRGGLLVGDEMKDEKPPAVDTVVDLEVVTASTDTGKTQPPSDEITTKLKKKSKEKKAKRDAENPDGPAESKAERRARKLERRAKKEAKREKKRAGKEPGIPETSNISAKELPVVEPAAPAQRPLAPGSRLSVRQRYIKQKRMSSMDPQALREILMLKS